MNTFASRVLIVFSVINIIGKFKARTKHTPVYIGEGSRGFERVPEVSRGFKRGFERVP
jgi:hypothetical protein